MQLEILTPPQPQQVAMLRSTLTTCQYQEEKTKGKEGHLLQRLATTAVMQAKVVVEEEG